MDPVGTGRRSRRRPAGSREDTVFDEVVLGQPDIIETVVFPPRDLIEDFAVEPIGWLAPLYWVAEVVPKAEADFSPIIAHDASLLAGRRRRLVLAPSEGRLIFAPRHRPQTARCR